MDLSAECWVSIKPPEREALAKRLAKQLPSGFAFQAVRDCCLGERNNPVAFYQQDQATFALVPGAAVLLGYDANRPWRPRPDELESWQATAEEYGIARTIGEYVADVTLRPRRVELSPFLIETAAGELGWHLIGVDDPDVQSILREYGAQNEVEFSRGGVSTRIRNDEKGRIVAERCMATTHADLAEQLAKSGFRFPTSDEWEYACAAGAPTLFRWGDHVPCDRYPTDVSPAEAAWQRRWVLSAGRLEHSAEGFSADWDYHRQPNAFGLRIALNPYKCELVSEIGVTRGGDGGSMICGGTGFFIGWLTLATAYFEEHSCRHDPDELISPGYTVGRRVLALK